ATVDAATRLTAVRAVCEDMNRSVAEYYRLTDTMMLARLLDGRVVMGPTDATSQVFYFGAGVERGTRAPRDVVDAASSCADFGIRFFVLDAPWISPVYVDAVPLSTPAGFRQIGYSVGVGMRIAPHQPGSPVTLTQRQLKFDSGYASTIVR